MTEKRRFLWNLRQIRSKAGLWYPGIHWLLGIQGCKVARLEGWKVGKVGWRGNGERGKDRRS